MVWTQNDQKHQKPNDFRFFCSNFTIVLFSHINLKWPKIIVLYLKKNNPSLVGRKNKMTPETQWLFFDIFKVILLQTKYWNKVTQNIQWHNDQPQEIYINFNKQFQVTWKTKWPWKTQWLWQKLVGFYFLSSHYYAPLLHHCAISALLLVFFP